MRVAIGTAMLACWVAAIMTDPRWLFGMMLLAVLMLLELTLT